MRELQNFLNSNNIYSVQDIKTIKDIISPYIENSVVNKRLSYLNIPASFDIETTSFYKPGINEDQKMCCMYVWTFCIYGLCVLGRTWGEFLRLYNYLIEEFNISLGNRLIIYVHNLSFDFSFFRKWLEWLKVFSIDSRKPVYALTVDGIEFRCSYLLTGYNLNMVSKHLQKYKVKKMVGDLDYKLIRHSKTVLSEKEINYCVNDVKVVVCHIAEQIEERKGIKNIPLTKTGYVREFCRNNCFYENGIPNKNSAKYLSYYSFIHRLNLAEEEYYQLKRAFQGGFTHANPFYVNEVVENVSSYDFTSDYPAVMVINKFPMSSSELITKMSKDDFYYNINNYCCLFEIELENVTPRILYENYISSSRCRELKNAQISNGRVVRADHLKTTITEQDFFIIEKFYNWSKIKIANFRRYKRGYLPTSFIKAVLKLYKDKTTLKNVKGCEVEYMQSKEMLNSCYGMMVTDIIRDEITYRDNMWDNEPGRADEPKPVLNIPSLISRYNKNKNRFLFYPWGVWVTAYARRRLFTGIMEFGNDYIYSDTDSIKVINADKHKDYIEKFNFDVRLKLYTAMSYHKLSLSLVEPETANGQKKLLGVWDYEETYKRFKTLGAKRYMVEKEEGINITVSGLNKSICVPYIIEKSKNNPFDFFTNNMDIPANFTGKQTHTYIDLPMGGVVKDYEGKEGEYYELSGVHLSNSPYSMSISQDFKEYIMNIKREYGGI